MFHRLVCLVPPLLSGTVFLLFALLCPPTGLTAAPATETDNHLTTSEGDTLWLVEEHVVWGDRIHAVTDYASRVDVIAPEQVQRRQQTIGANALSAIASLPGVTYRKVGLVANGASGDPPAAFRIRGVGSIPNDGLLVLVDGRPQYVGVWGHSLPDAHRLGPVQRIEVVRGPASVQFGSQAFGGVVNIITSGAANPGTELVAAGGNHGSYNLSLDHRQQAGPVTCHLAGSRARTDGYRGGDGSWVDGMRGDLTWNVVENWRLTALADGSHSFFNNPGPETGLYTSSDMGSGDINQRAVDVSLDRRGQHWTTRMKLYHNYVHNDFHQAGNTKARDFGVRLFGELRRTSYAVKGGFDLDRYGGNFTVNENPGFVPVDAYDVNAAPYVLARINLTSRVTAAGGLRVNFSDRYATEWIPQGRLLFSLDSHTLLTLAAAKGFKTPSIAEQYLPFLAGDRTLLEPERMWQYELGLSRDFAGWDAELAAFQSEGSNLIKQAAPGWPPPYDNSGAFRHQGVEMSLRRDPRQQLGMTFGTAWMLERDDQTQATPALSSQLGLWLRATRTLRFDLTLDSEIDRYGSDAHHDPLPDLLLFSSGITWTVPWRISNSPGSQNELFLTVNNLTDQNYRIFSDYPMPGVIYSLGLRLQR
ncbi:MAG: TonB-dependent receptor [bacterium]